jgi:hypothetical protein
MIEETIRQMEARLGVSTNLAPETRAELLALLAKLREEAKALPARPEVSAAPPSTDPLDEASEVKTLQEDVNHLRNSVEEFEDSHPKVTQLVNHIANTLAGLGI